jgi:DNA-binding CsgD family transcriptional regulator/tetratricopeptide (TPR) repeat protein
VLPGRHALSVHAPHAALEQFNRAVSAVRSLGLAPTAPLYQARGGAYEVLGDFSSARSDYEAALSAARGAGNRQEEWQALVALGALWTWRDYATTGSYFRDALELARTMSDASTIARSLNRVGNWHLNQEEPVRAMELHRDALATFQQLADRPAVADTLSLLSMSSYLGGDLLRGTEYCHQAISAFAALGDHRAEVGTMASLALGCVNMVTDTCVPALSPAEAAYAVERSLAAARTIGWRAGEAFAQFNLAYCFGALGDYGSALTAAQAVALGVKADLALATRRPGEALRILDRFMGSDSAAPGQFPMMLGPVHLRARALAALAPLQEAEAKLTQLGTWAGQQGLLPALWRIQVTLGGVQAAQRRRAKAGETFAAARGLVHQLAANLPPHLRTTFVSQAETRLPRSRQRSEMQAVKAASGGLTARERQVATLVAQGQANSEIAHALVVGERTIETHVANILAKLGLQSRRQVIAWANQKDLQVGWKSP